MNSMRLILCAVTLTGITPGTALAQRAVHLVRQPELVPAANDDSYSRPNAEASPSDYDASYVPARLVDMSVGDDDGAELSSEPESSCGCEPGCGCDNGCCDGCDNGCGCDGGWGNCLGDCCLGDAWTLSSCLTPNCCDGPEWGGWISFGYYNHNERLSFRDGDSLSFNDFPDHLNLDQAWLYVEKVAEAEGCSADYGYRFDMMYGVHGHAAQSYGNPRSFEPVFGKNLGAWDASLDHGPYAWAAPQAYGEVAYGDWSLKVGHWFTPVGYEVIPDTGNFFYSHTLTHYNSEPFTHTGILATLKGFDKVTPIVGWALGWDTGFDQFDGGNIYVGGATFNVTDDVAFTYMNTIGNLGWRSGGEFGFTQHIVNVANLSENMAWVLQSDYLHTDGTITDSAFANEDKGVTNYLTYKLNDCWGVGARLEWWKSNFVAVGDDISFYDATAGVNYKPHANVTIRPEIRYDWTPAADTVNDALGANYNQWWFGIDAVTTY